MICEMKKDLQSKFHGIVIEAIDVDRRKQVVKVFVAYNGDFKEEEIESYLGPKQAGYADFVSARHV